MARERTSEVEEQVAKPDPIPSRGVTIGTFSAMVFGRLVNFRDGDAVMVSPVEYREYARLNLPIIWDDA
ncbi:MAG TPA: hypothetical protein PK231_03035 [Acidocella sp.]|nr:hypothetical protein [Acidocella sp.]